MMRRLGVIFSALIAVACNGQRLIRSHLVQAEGGETRAVLVVRKFETFDDPDLTLFRITNAKYLRPGDYHVGYFVDTGFVHSEWMHVSHQRSVVDQFIVVGRIDVKDLRFGAGVSAKGVTYINTAPLEP